MIHIGINGFGRIGKNLWHLLLNETSICVSAVNHPMITIDLFKYMANNDTLLPHINVEIEDMDGDVLVNGRKVKLTGFNKPSEIEWEGVDVVVDCSGKFKNKEELRGHLRGDVKMVILSAPAGDDMDVVINGVSEIFEDNIISCGSCTTNCLAPVLDVIDKKFGVEFCNFLTVHAMTASQTVSDRKNIKDFRLGRNAFQNIIPTTTGASRLVKKLFPHLVGRVFGSSCRVPVENGSYLEINFKVKEDVDVESIFDALENNEIIEISDNKNVSSDIKKLDKICCIDKDLVVVYNEKTFKIGVWYNNEAGYVRQIIEFIRKNFI